MGFFILAKRGGHSGPNRQDITSTEARAILLDGMKICALVSMFAAAAVCSRAGGTWEGEAVASDIRDGTVRYAELRILPRDISTLKPTTPEFVLRVGEAVRIEGGQLVALSEIFEKMTCRPVEGGFEAKRGIVFFDNKGQPIHSVSTGEQNLFGGGVGAVDGRVCSMDGLLQAWIQAVCGDRETPK